MTPEEKQKIWEIFKPYIKEAALAYCLDELNAMPEESECWACKNSGVVYADYEPQDCPCCAMLEESDNGCWNCKHMYDIPYEAKLCKVSEYPEGGAMECWEVAGCKNWLDQGGE